MRTKRLIKYVLCVVCFFQVNNTYTQSKTDINGLIDKMTIEEKVGQMTQINLGFLSSSIDQHDGKVKQIDESLQSNDFCENQSKIDLHLGPC